MRLLRKLLIKLITMVVMVVLMGALLRLAKPYLMKSAGMPEGMPSVEGVAAPKFSSNESDLMATFFKSAVRLFTGQAKREELASELSDKLYADRGGAAAMSELGIELEKPGAKPTDPAGPTKPAADSSVGTIVPASPEILKPDAKATAKTPPASKPAATNAANPARDALLARLMEKAKANPELSLVPVVVLGMFVMRLFRRRPSPADDLMMPDMSKLIPSESDDYQMTHPVHSLSAEDFELLVGMIYQRQGYRVTMPAGRGGGTEGDFMVQRKSERLLVQCKRLNPTDKVDVDRVRKLQEAAAACGATRGVYVASCGFSWDARNFAKTKGVTIINAKTLDLLLNEARETPDEDFLAVWDWAPKFMKKVKLTPPLCPACEASMDELTVSSGPVWVCSQRPECRGRRSARKHHFSMPAATVGTYANSKPKTQPIPEPPSTAREEWRPPSTLGGRARTICPSTS